MEFSRELRIYFIIHFMLILLLLLYRYKMRGQRLGWTKRRWWTRPCNSRRVQLGGEYENQFQEWKMDNDHVKFFNHTRLSVSQFNALLSMVEPLLRNHHWRALSPEHQLVITLDFLASGTSFHKLATCYRVGVSTVGEVVKRTCTAIVEALQQRYLRQPNDAEFRQVMQGFWVKRQMPCCFGAIDGKHIRIQQPPNSGSLYYNYKGFYSIILLAAVDVNYNFLMVDVGQYGAVSDGGVFCSSEMGKAILNETAGFPQELLRLPNAVEKRVKGFFVADEAFPLSVRIMRPYPGSGLSKNQRIFNYRLARARVIVENTFGVLTARWRALRGPMCLDVDFVSLVVFACCSLHNFIKKSEQELPLADRQYCPPQFVDRETRDGVIIPGEWRRMASSDMVDLPRINLHQRQRNAHTARNDLMEFFTTHGAVPWQDSYI